MKTHAIIPVFIPHAGCPHNCVFCNQRAITAHNDAPSPDETVKIIERNMETIRASSSIRTVEIAFYGGSFTGIPLEQQTAYLEIAYRYKKEGMIDYIHLSTRPDYIDRTILENLKKYGTDIIELGVQSFDEDVLKASARGHSREIVYRSAALIKEYGFSLGIQLMTGLPGDSYEKCMFSAAETVRLAPDIARIYPTVVIKDTPLFDMYEKGLYIPQDLDSAADTVKDMYKMLTGAGINVIRVGLKSTEIIKNEDGAVVGGYHPAFRQLVQSRIAREEMEAVLEKQLNLSGKNKASEIIFFSCPEEVSDMSGHKKQNRIYFEKRFPDASISFRADPELKKGTFKVKVQ